jgi:hypothetical protein
MQSRNGGWGSFDADNTHYYLNHIPFADHGALLDPRRPMSPRDASASSLRSALLRIIVPSSAATEFLRREQEPEGSWLAGGGRILFTEPGRCSPPLTRRVSSSASAGGAAGGGLAGSPPARRRRLGRKRRILLARAQHDDTFYSTPSQTVWALLGLMAAGQVEHPAVVRGIDFLVNSQDQDGNWDEPWCTAVGFPRLLFALPRLPHLLSALGACSLSAAEERKLSTGQDSASEQTHLASLGDQPTATELNCCTIPPSATNLQRRSLLWVVVSTRPGFAYMRPRHRMVEQSASTSCRRRSKSLVSMLRTKVSTTALIVAASPGVITPPASAG